MRLRTSGYVSKISSRLLGRIVFVACRGPADAVVDERDKLRIAPRPLVVTPSSVEHAALANFTHPRVRLVTFFVASFREHDAIRVVLRVNVTFVPAFNRRESFRHGMLTVHDRLLENSRAVTLE